MSGLPPNVLETRDFASEVCAVCGADWETHVPSIPTVYTERSIDFGLPPQPICDLCVEAGDSVRFAELLSDRQRFWADWVREVG
jgi:hypothetical protein